MISEHREIEETFLTQCVGDGSRRKDRKPSQSLSELVGKFKFKAKTRQGAKESQEKFGHGPLE